MCKLSVIRQKGFTLIELMIVVVVIAILAAIAYPSYQNSVTKARRTEGKALLLLAVQKQEQYMTRQSRYADTLSDLNLSSTSDNGYYTLTLDTLNNTSQFSFEVTPSGGHSDSECGIFTLNYLGVKGVKNATSTASACW